MKPRQQNNNNDNKEKVVWNAQLMKFDPFLQNPAEFNCSCLYPVVGVAFPFAQNLFAFYGGH